jgi:lipoic acid synthetase
MRTHPDWLKVKLPSGKNYQKINSLVREHNLNTVCQEARCPNKGECWDKGTATFLILGDSCTRNCNYCNVQHNTSNTINTLEPISIANTIKKLNLNYAVITSVTRDDLEDGGANHFAKTIEKIKKLTNCKVEVLTPDFQNDVNSIKTITNTNPDVFAHNIEVVKPLFQKLRPQGSYNNSINFLKNIKSINKNIKTKSGLMIGFGETKQDIINTLKDLKRANVDILTIGQYLQPRKDLHKIEKYYTPEEFKELEQTAKDLGFKHVYSGPLVRSSYNAEKVFQ